MKRLKVGDKVRVTRDSHTSGTKTGMIGTIVNDDGSNLYPFDIKVKGIRYGIMGSGELKLISKSKSKGTTMKNKKPEFGVGDIVYNNYNSQKSKVLAVAWDAEDEMYKYTLQCLDDSGSLHLIYEESISEIEVIKVTVAELKAYYEENENVEVVIKK